MEQLFINPYLVYVAAFFSALFLAWISIPSIVHISRVKHLFDEPNGRSSHTEVTPSLGGVAIFSGFLISYLILGDIGAKTFMPPVVAGMIVIFFMGLKDDLLVLDPKKKLVGQILVAALVVFLGDLRISNLNGLLHIHELNIYISYALSIFLIVMLTNAVNLIDGIDGLASGTVFLAAFTFGIWFTVVGNIEGAILSFCLAGTLVAFFKFNVYGKRNKIFMGDTGSLLIGYLITIIAFRFNELNIDQAIPYSVHAPTVVIFGILVVPIYDTLRVFVSRVMSGRSPFSPDKTHIHHRLLILSGSHRKATYIILFVNLCFIALAFLLNALPSTVLFFIIFTLAAILSYIPVIMMKNRQITIHTIHKRDKSRIRKSA
ncbi:MAG: undecaprenyl/decaprenyl-phosphate alpha-N-acetylglucosaminyl 1-phosphate transferase [Bacteroidales bacterium]|nr:undecaprenyl/decaprenyl-phosphate alpha-N-acetylglucosaminyl 1-phosphate transferase [Bacteroidales bacterium]